ncbi:hypothetical protein MLD38_017226 [Melastoma candidum]|uniref:Uncharacterized protein n=1 Tax=Melastoma candidum TaxID=119954 RepID=A0ACB9QQ53_9MYRT|nr:hypothetical protein MLD38_017226 [Melastoma candidum]
MANRPEDDSSYDRLGDDAVPAPPLHAEEVIEPSPGLVEGAEVPDGGTIPSKQDEEEVVEASEGLEDGGNEETSGRGGSLDHVNAALVVSVAAVAIVGALVAIAKKLRER